MNVGSLFTGAGLMDWGLALAGFDHAWFCESDPFCRAVLERRWPGASIFKDIRTLSATERVDLLAGGFPCQDVSEVGRRAGLAGEQSGLWSEFARLIRELRPGYVLVENVPGLLVRGMGTVLGDLAACGYDAEWDCLPAAAFGAPHLRARIFVLAYPCGRWGSDDRLLAGRNPARRGGEAIAVANTEGVGCGPFRENDSCKAWADNLPRHAGEREGSNAWASEPDVGRVADGVPARVDRLRALGNGVVPQIAEWIGRRILEAEQLRSAA